MRSPLLVRAVAVFTGLFSFRLVAGGLRAASALSGAIPTVFAVGGFGDALAGLLAPYVTWRLLKRPDPTTWLIACLWHLYSACDFVFANAAHLFATGGLWFDMNGAAAPVGMVRPVVLATLVLLDVAVVVALARAPARRWFSVPA